MRRSHPCKHEGGGEKKEQMQRSQKPLWHSSVERTEDISVSGVQ